jgi:zinc protease
VTAAPEWQTGQAGPLRLFWSDADGPTLRAGLSFRVGLIDETLPRLGLTALWARWAAGGPTRPQLQVAATGHLLTTDFQVAGPPAMVADALTQICDRLSQSPAAAGPALDRLAWTLINTGHSEGEGRLGQAWAERYGPNGPGLAASRRYGLESPDLPALTSWAASRFTSANAVLCLDGPPPPGLAETLAQALPAGPPQPLPPLPLELHRGQAYTQDYSGLTATAILPDGPATIMLLGLTHQRLFQDLRLEAGVAYDPFAGLLRFGPQALVAVGTDTLYGSEAEAAQVLAETLEELATAGPQPPDLAAALAAATPIEDTPPEAAQAEPFTAGRRALLGQPYPGRAAQAAALAAVTPDQVQAAAAQFRDSILVGVGPGSDLVDLPWPEVPAPPSDPPIEGRRHIRTGSAGAATAAAGTGTGLICGPVGLALERSQPGRPLQRIAIPWDRLAAALVNPGGTVTLMRDDGRAVNVNPALWRDAAAVRDAIGQYVAADRWVWRRHPDGTPQAEHELPPVPKPTWPHLYGRLIAQLEYPTSWRSWGRAVAIGIASSVALTGLAWVLASLAWDHWGEKLGALVMLVIMAPVPFLLLPALILSPGGAWQLLKARRAARAMVGVDGPAGQADE